ncbi:hypothetical protein H5410_026928 [Solanum commersonii]|uniref:Uncharacterized protein n=1 Tax=Solanum commersonii TaxID=4109 RepID=A0A9J5Z219_SOLCO|nr:hypothetical protein H5410_026928 [Solanum commersonii]
MIPAEVKQVDPGNRFLKYAVLGDNAEGKRKRVKRSGAILCRSKSISLHLSVLAPLLILMNEWVELFLNGKDCIGQDNQPPLIPELHPPLLDDDTSQAELASRLRTILWGKAYREEMIDSVVDTQVKIEKHIQAALVGRDYSVESLLAKRHQIKSLLIRRYEKQIVV